jgi:hypothetical protein
MGMLKEISQLQIELAEYERTVAHMRDGARAVLERAEKAEAELAACREDAERYRWLRDQNWTQRGLFVVSANGRDVVLLGTNCPSGDLLDSAIKQARKEQKRREGWNNTSSTKEQYNAMKGKKP